MPKLRDDEFFLDAIEEAAERAGLPPGLLEKDYWVSEVLRELSSRYRERFLFKGGTSLSKAYGLIERFSEDIDLLVLSDDPADGPAVDRLLREICDVGLAITGGDETDVRSVAGSYLDVTFSYPTKKPRAGGLHKGIRIDSGIAGGPLPSEAKSIRPMLAQYFREADGYSVDAFEDLVPFEVNVLHPARTLVEKLSGINAMIERAKKQEEGRRKIQSRDARHFYDVYHLLDDQKSGALTKLQEVGLEAIVADCEEVNRRWYAGAGSKVRPDGGFASSAAFTDGELAPELRRAYDKAVRDFCFPTAGRPSWDEVCARVAEHKERL